MGSTNTPIMKKIKIHASEHLMHKLKVHHLLSDFELEDVWRVPVELNADHTLKLFMDQFKKSDDSFLKRGVAGWLFKLRIFLGWVFGWDKIKKSDQLIPGTIRARYASHENLTHDDLPHPGSGEFIPVYQIENEFLSEIENKTVHAAVHFSRVPLRDNVWGVHMAVYVKPKGLFGRMYMWLIKPFRVWIVYPAMMKAAKERWEAYLAAGEG